MRSLTDRRCRGRRPRRPAEVRGGGRQRRGQDPSLRCKNKWVATARPRAGHARPLRNMVMWDVERPAPRPPGRLAAMRSLTDRRCRGRRPRRPAEVRGGGRQRRGQDPSLRCKNKWVATARPRAGHARPLRNMVMWDVERPAPRPPGRLAAMRSLTDCRCRGRRPQRPAEVSGGGRCAGGMNSSPTGYLLAGVGRKAAEGSRPLPTMQRINRR